MTKKYKYVKNEVSNRIKQDGSDDFQIVFEEAFGSFSVFKDFDWPDFLLAKIPRHSPYKSNNNNGKQFFDAFHPPFKIIAVYKHGFQPLMCPTIK
jgi:hypothetical protein